MRAMYLLKSGTRVVWGSPLNGLDQVVSDEECESARSAADELTARTAVLQQGVDRTSVRAAAAAVVVRGAIARAECKRRQQMGQV